MAPSANKKKERSTLSAGDWEQQALVLIAEKGIRAVAVEALAKRMGVTKGSFYWHFPNRDALLEQSLLRWEKHDAANKEDANPRERGPAKHGSILLSKVTAPEPSAPPSRDFPLRARRSRSPRTSKCRCRPGH